MASLRWGVFLVLLLQLGKGVQSRNYERCPRPADIVFVLDASTSIYAPDFTKQLVFVKNVTRYLDIDQSAVRCGVLTFAETVRVEFGLKTHSSQEAIIGAVSKVQQLAQTMTNTFLGIEQMRKMFEKEGRPNVHRIGIVITDGQSHDGLKTAQEAELAKKAGIIMFAIGVGPQVNDAELKAIASKDDFVFRIDNYGALDTIMGILKQKACDSQPNDQPAIDGDTDDNEAPARRADVFFIIADTTTITITEFTIQLNFVIKIVSIFKVSKNGIRVGLLTFGDQPNPQFGLDTYSSVSEVQSAMARISQTKSGSNTGKALNYARENVFTEKSQRIGARRLVVLITDSKSSDLGLTAKEATLLKNIGVTVLAVGVGNNVDKNELVSIASEPTNEYAITVKDYSSLEATVTDIVVSKVLPGRPEKVAEYGCAKTKPADIVFSLPSRMDDQERKHGLRFLEALAGRLDIGLGPVQFGLAPCHCYTVSGFSLADGWGRAQVSSYVGKHTQSDEVDEATTTLRSIHEVGFSSKGGADRSKVAVVVFDRRSVRLTKAAVKEASLLKEKKISVYLFGVGPRSSSNAEDELASLAGCSACVLTVDTYEQLQGMADKAASTIINHLCASKAK